MTYTVKIRTLPGSPMMCEYECPDHGRFEQIVTRDENGDPPDLVACPHTEDRICQRGLAVFGVKAIRAHRCNKHSELTIGAPSIKFWSRDPVPIGHASKHDEKDPRALDTEPLATGKMTKAEWTRWQKGISKERRYQKQIKSGRRSKRIQVG